ncbi:hypothetical protein M514_26016, partial [Trichuris suis]
MPSLGWRGSRRGRSAKALPKASGMVRGLATVNGDTLSELSRQPLNRVPTVWGSSRSLAAPRRWTPVHFSPLSPGVGWSTYSNFETVQSLPSTPVPPSSPTFSEPTLPVFALNANAYEYPRRVTTFEENSNGIACNSRPFRLRPITHGSIANGRTFYKPACGLEAIREGIESRRYFKLWLWRTIPLLEPRPQVESDVYLSEEVFPIRLSVRARLVAELFAAHDTCLAERGNGSCLILLHCCSWRIHVDSATLQPPTNETITFDPVSRERFLCPLFLCCIFGRRDSRAKMASSSCNDNTDPTVNAQTANALGRNKWSLPVEPKEGTSHHVEPVKATTLTREAASAKIARKNEDVDLHSASSPDSQRLRSWSNPGANPYQKSS